MPRRPPRKRSAEDIVKEWFRFHVSDWLSSPTVLLMTHEERGIFIHLLALAWRGDKCSLPSDWESLARLCQCQCIPDGVRSQFIEHQLIPGRVTNPKLFSIWQEQLAHIKKTSRAGKLASEERWRGMRSHTDGNADEERSVCREGKGREERGREEKREEETPPTPSPRGRTPPFPSREIIRSWNRICTDLPQVNEDDPPDALLTTMRARWKQHPELTWFESIFEIVHESDFLCGRREGDDSPWQCSLPWVLGPKNLAKIQSGQYRNRTANPRLVSKIGRVNEATMRAAANDRKGLVALPSASTDVRLAGWKIPEGDPDDEER